MPARCLFCSYSSAASIEAAIDSGRGVYYSRSRGGLWRKGDTSGAIQVSACVRAFVRLRGIYVVRARARFAVRCMRVRACACACALSLIHI